jgi:hypothetical protein
MAPPTAQTPTGPTSLQSITAGSLRCPAGRLEVGGPTTNPYDPFSPYVDWYVAHLWRWDGTRWTAVGFGPWAYKPRYTQSWTTESGAPATTLSFPVEPGYWYAATQWIFDGQAGGYWPQVHATFLTGFTPYCHVG